MGSNSMDNRQRVTGIVSAIDAARETLLAYDPPWVDPGYEEVREQVDRTLRQVQLAVSVILEDSEKAPIGEA